MKLVDRSKFLTIGESPQADAPSQDRNNYYGRVYKCVANTSKMTLFERLWLTPELYEWFGKYRKSNIWWFLLTLFIPFADDFYNIFKHENILDLTVVEFFACIFAIIITLCGLGWVWSILRANYDIKHGRKEIKRI